MLARSPCRQAHDISRSELPPGRQGGCRVALMHVTFRGTTIEGRSDGRTGCEPHYGLSALSTKSSRPNLQPWPEIRPDFRVEVLRARMHGYSITFAADVDLAAAAIEQRAADSTVRRNALLLRGI